MSTAHDVLRQTFGFEQFRPGQREVIDHLLAGRSAAAVFPTGSGKSLCYQVPALLLPGLTVVVSPLIALMKEQIDRLQARGIAAERLDSTRDAEQVAAITTAMRAGQLRLLYVAPERFNNERFRSALQHVRVALFAVDEAHCISEWGHNFRPDYLKLSQFSCNFRAERVLALTATATPQVLADICRSFRIDAACAVRTGFYRANLTVIATPTRAQERDDALLHRLTSRPAGSSIVYVTLQRTAEQVAKRLAAAGLPARAYHAGLANELRAEIQDWFAQTAHAVVVATIAFGMGIDKADIRAVYHYNLPKSLENWSQEIGRAGRDGLPAHCEMFVCPQDLNALENFVYGDTPALSAVHGLMKDIFGRPEDFDVSFYDLAADHDIRQLVLNTLLTYLELDGYLEAGTPFYARYQFQPLCSSAEILARFTDERRTFLATVLRQAVKARTWFTLDLEKAAESAGATRDRVVSALQYLEEQQLLTLKVEGVRNRYHRRRTPTDLNELARTLHQRTVEREAREIGRLRQVLELAGHDGCLTSRLSEHFGEPLAQPCGHCSWCLNGHRPAAIPPRPAAVIDPALRDRVGELCQEHAQLFADPRALARFLCGLTSPRLSRAKLGSHPLFGALDQVPFPQVLEWTEG